MNKNLIASLTIALLFISSLLSAAPQGHDEMRQGRNAQSGGKAPSNQSQSQKQGQSKTGQTPQKSPAKSHAQQPPKDFSSVHQAFHERREQIGRGGPLPAEIRIQQGKPLPKGYGKRLDAKVLKGLPQYQGYEWRRVGSDIVLVAVTTGIVYTILQGVLN
ncbi:anti-virulence regulator CigR family protein [Stutzerimonas chloritidismutans]|uniref:anti-virulence regulator CigR family protein n=1 Tax=Stutzerimonas chloritidismutans TaxID=203192 RepID=UPI001D197430|nr:anti-virulence regulator CigR family protein [Stutzerimonas chloritidismutans]MDH2246220.1 RcnB family protein [Pseudomonas sp. GD03856]MDH2263324.1 RcnB family protein [Pseudomonas sp. GD03855]UEG61792.1 RcnB family protein [Stutzerimonas chloritidismutans]